jgi:hypothetical protein
LILCFEIRFSRVPFQQNTRNSREPKHITVDVMPQLHSILPGEDTMSSATATTQSNAPADLYLALAVGKPLLRVGVMLDDWKVPAWVADVLQSIQGSGVALVTTVILNRETREATSNPAATVEGPVRAKSAGFRTCLWDRYVRSDQKRKSEFARLFHLTDVHRLLTNAREIELAPLHNGSVHQFNGADISAVKDDCLDVIVRFGLSRLGGGILSAATYGVWSYDHGDNNRHPGGPVGFWEMYDRSTLSGTVLQILMEDLDGGRVIYRSYGATQSFESLVENQYWSYRKAIPFVTRCLRRVYEDGAAGLRSEPKAAAKPRRFPRTPRNYHMLRFFLYIQWMRLVVRIQDRLKVQRDHWFLAIARGVAPGQQLNGKAVAVYPPKGRFWADPMLVRHKGQVFMFFEEYDYKLRRAHISVVHVDENGHIGVPRIALKADYNLSYPFIFQWNGAYYMVPETASVRAVRLYRCVDFPSRWEYHQDLLSGIRAVDATLCEHAGRWYLFTNVSEAGGSSWDELFLFMADTPMGPWKPHPMNPIVSDVRCARPGGALFRREGVLYRPAQNSQKLYGHSLSIMEVTELTPHRYAERVALRIEPDWLPNICGCHTITMADGLMALDCKALTWRAGLSRKLNHDAPLSERSEPCVS